MKETRPAAAAARDGRRTLPALATLAAALLAGCAPPPAPALTPEASLPACQSGALAELRRLDPAVESATLGPVADAAVERRTPPPGGPGVGLVIAGRGTAAGGWAGSTFRYTCLVGTAGPVLFVDVRPQGTGQVMAECAGRPEGQRVCLRGLASGAEAALVKAEAAAVAAARRAAAGRSRAEIDEPAAASIGAWRVYRDAECARRHSGAPPGAVPPTDDREAACLVELTRARIGELSG